MLISEEQHQNISINTAFEEAFNKELAKQLLKRMDVQKILTIWVKNFEYHCKQDDQHKIINWWHKTKTCY